MSELKLLFAFLKAMGNTLQFIKFDLSLDTGLDYYTGVMHEAVSINPLKCHIGRFY